MGAFLFYGHSTGWPEHPSTPICALRHWASRRICNKCFSLFEECSEIEYVETPSDIPLAPWQRRKGYARLRSDFDGVET